MIGTVEILILLFAFGVVIVVFAALFFVVMRRTATTEPPSATQSDDLATLGDAGEMNEDEKKQLLDGV